MAAVLNGQSRMEEDASQVVAPRSDPLDMSTLDMSLDEIMKNDSKARKAGSPGKGPRKSGGGTAATRSTRRSFAAKGQKFGQKTVTSVNKNLMKRSSAITKPRGVGRQQQQKRVEGRRGDKKRVFVGGRGSYVIVAKNANTRQNGGRNAPMPAPVPRKPYDGGRRFAGRSERRMGGVQKRQNNSGGGVKRGFNGGLSGGLNGRIRKQIPRVQPRGMLYQAPHLRGGMSNQNRRGSEIGGLQGGGRNMRPVRNVRSGGRQFQNGQRFGDRRSGGNGQQNGRFNRNSNKGYGQRRFNRY